RWIEQRMARVLDVDYFHVVFTLPAALRPLAFAHRRQVFALLLRAAAQTLLTLGHDPKRLGAELGITAVLHTWTRELEFHPHGRTATLHPEEFLRRLLLHVLPAGFVKIRHTGLFAPRQVPTTLPIARRLLADRPQPTASAAPSPWASLLQRLTGIDLTRCPRCDRSPLDRRVLVPYAPRPPP